MYETVPCTIDRKPEPENSPVPATCRRAVLALFFAMASIVSWSPAHAVPSFARQTGMQCNACHTAYPALNAFGREFKLNSYSFTGGNPDLPPIAALVQPSFTHTARSQPGLAPHFADNDNPAIQQASIFYGGTIYDRLGAFAQVTYDGIGRRFAIDNTDIRFSRQTDIAGTDFLYGVTLNNNPTVQDPWNTTPAWGFPYASNDLVPGPAASTLIDGGLAQQIAGLGGYARWNNLVYAEITGYRTLPRDGQTALGVSPEGEDQIDGYAPYWRVALQTTWGNNYLSGGTFGLVANTFPGRDSTAGSDQRVDFGLDAQYEYSADKHNLGVYLRWIRERADWNAGNPLGNTDNPHDKLTSFNATASYLYDQTYGADLNFFDLTGDTDATLYGSRTSKPDTRSVSLQLDYLPFNRNGGPSFWPTFNPKLIARYTWFTKFDGSSSDYDGTGRKASDNNTLYAMMWLPF